MMKEKMAFLITIWTFFIQVFSYTSTSPVWLTSPYFRAGNDKVISTMTGNTSMPMYTFTFSSALSGIPNLAYGIKNYRGNDTLLNQMFEIRRVNLTASTFKVSMQIFGYTNIFLLAVPYLAIDPLFPHHLNSFDNVPLNYSSGPLSNFSTYSMSALYHTETINYTQQSAANTYKAFQLPLSSNKIVLFISSLYVLSSGTTTSLVPLQISINYTILNTTHYKWSARLYQNATVTSLRFSQIIYNEDDIAASKTYAVVYQQWTLNSSGGYQVFPKELTDNMILALTDFSTINGRCGLQFNWYFMTNYSSTPFGLYVNASQPLNYNCGLNSARAILFYIKTWQCSVPYIYYNLTASNCQDGCATYYYANTTAKTCDSCYYACINCSTGSNPTACTQCQTAAHRSNVSNKCVCDSGYFDDGYQAVCRSCSTVDSHCLICTYSLNTSQTTSYYQTIFNSTTWATDILPNYTCTSCVSNYFINSSGLCQTCGLTYCITCLNLTACSVCNSTALAVKYTNNICYLCNVSNCAMCSANNYCSTCNSGYALNSGSCTSCSTNCSCGGWVTPKVSGVCSTLCGDGYKLGTQQCDDGNTVSHDGCSSTCQIQTCAQSCSCNDGWILPWVNGSCSTLCGDGFKVGTQQCDDNNTVSHDGCSSTCQTQTCAQNCSCSGWILPWINATSSCTTLCGDGYTVGTQQCDDHNTLSHDGCSSTCQIQTCAQNCSCNGWVLPWISATSSCSTLCGDGYIVGTQQCDDNNTVSHDGCSSTCKNQTCAQSCSCNDGYILPLVNGSCSTLCGDGFKVGTQQCDDNNTVSHDGCSSTCVIQTCTQNCSCSGWVLPWINATSSCSTLCGDGYTVGTQMCDDNNTDSHDGCSSSCVIQTCAQNCSCNGWVLPWVNGSCSTLCGDGYIVGTQQCDDNNSVSHDGCSSTCQIQTCAQNCSCNGWVLPWVNGSCSTVCGDGFKVGTQQCEDNNTVSHDGCSSTCRIQNCSQSCLCNGWVLPWVNGSCSTLCGDGYTIGTQQCDDNNTVNHDGCSSTCLIQNCSQSCFCDGWVTPWVNTSCSTLCGDGYTVGIQQCDDNNTVSHDGCSSTCQIQTCAQNCSCNGWALPWLNVSCSTICGDGYTVGTQQCDDNNTVSHDGCSSTCLIQTCSQSCLCDGWTSPYSNSSCATICGDNLLRGLQQCDDGNNIDHDGCSSTCTSQPCNVSCNCDGWTHPFINGSCTTVCGDGLIRGSQQCDDGNLVNGDHCDNNCLNQLISNTPPVVIPSVLPVIDKNQTLVQKQYTQYFSLFLFALGFRIVGMEMLNVFQSFQLLLQSQKITNFQISFNIHGYSDKSYFPFEIPVQKHIFTNFNFMYVTIILVFVVSILMELCKMVSGRNNKIKNSMEDTPKINNTQTDSNSNPSQHSDQIGDFAVHYKQIKKNKSNQQTGRDNLNQTTLSKDEDSKSILTVIFRQIFYDLLINCQYVFVFSLAQQIMVSQISSFQNFTSFITVASMILFLIVILIFCSMQSSAFGENQLKFHQGKWMNYWILTVAQRIVFATILACNYSWSLYSILALKLILIIYYSCDNIYFQKIQKRRSLVIHWIHFTLILLIMLNQTIFKDRKMLTSLPTFFMEYIYIGLLSVVLFITLCFYIRQIMFDCEADFRNDNNSMILTTQSNGAVSAIFDAKNNDDLMQDSSQPFDMSNFKSSNIFDDLKSRNFNPSASHLQLPSGKSYGMAKSKKIISINYINYVNDALDIQEMAVHNSRKSYQTHKRGTKKMNVFDQDQNLVPPEQNNQNYVEQELDQQSTPKVAKHRGMKSIRRIGLKNKKRQNLQKTKHQLGNDQDLKVNKSQVFDKKDLTRSQNILKQSNGIKQGKKQYRMKTFYKNNNMNVKKTQQEQNSDNYDALSISFQ